MRAARLLQQETGCTLGADITLEKRMPMGGGLGGGSSDAATTLLALNRLWQLNLPAQALQELGLRLGADVPVFVFGENAFAEGVGEHSSRWRCRRPGMWCCCRRCSAHRRDFCCTGIDTGYEFHQNIAPFQRAAEA